MALFKFECNQAYKFSRGRPSEVWEWVQFEWSELPARIALPEVGQSPLLGSTPRELAAGFHSTKDLPRLVGIWIRAKHSRQVQYIVNGVEISRCLVMPEHGAGIGHNFSRILGTLLVEVVVVVPVSPSRLLRRRR